MNQKLLLIALIMISTRAGAQDLDHYAWVKLAGNRVLVNVQLLHLRADSLVVLRDGRPVVVPVSHILSIKILHESSILSGTAIGAGIGAFSGAAVGVVLSSDDKDTWNPVSTSLYGCVIGGIIGAVTSSAGNSERILDLERATMDERILMLTALLEDLYGPPL